VREAGCALLERAFEPAPARALAAALDRGLAELGVASGGNHLLRTRMRGRFDPRARDPLLARSADEAPSISRRRR
jgi:hypothetical protein